METALSLDSLARSAAVIVPRFRKSSRVMTPSYTRRKYAVNHELRAEALKDYARCGIMPPMVGKRIYLKEWRKASGRTQAEVVAMLEGMGDEQLPKTEASLSRLENGKQPYSERVLLALADIYGCEPWELIGRNPTKAGEVVDMVRLLDEREQERVRAYIEGLRAGA